jgi:hypothetical protein
MEITDIDEIKLYISFAPNSQSAGGDILYDQGQSPFSNLRHNT